VCVCVCLCVCVIEREIQRQIDRQTETETDCGQEAGCMYQGSDNHTKRVNPLIRELRMEDSHSGILHSESRRSLLPWFTLQLKTRCEGWIETVTEIWIEIIIRR